MLDVHRIKVGAGPVPEPDPDDGPSANRSMPNYTAEPDPNDLVYADERTVGPYWTLATVVVLLIAANAAYWIEVVLAVLLGRAYDTTIPTTSRTWSRVLIILFVLYRTAAIRFRRLQTSTRIYQDRLVLRFADGHIVSVFTQDIVRIRQEGSTLRVETRVVVGIRSNGRKTIWKISSKASEALARNQPHNVRVYTGDIHRVMQAMMNAWDIVFDKRYSLRPQDILPKPAFPRRRLALPAQSGSPPIVLRRFVMICLALITSHYLLVVVRQLLGLYVGAAATSTECVLQGTAVNGTCTTTFFEYYDLFIGAFVVTFIVNQCWAHVAQQVDLFNDRIRVQTRSGLFINVLLRDIRYIRFCRPDPLVAPGALTVYTTQYHTCRQGPRDLHATLTVVRGNEGYAPVGCAPHRLLRLLDGAFHPLILLSKDDLALLEATLTDLRRTTCTAMGDYEQEMARVQAEEAALRKVNKVFRLKRPRRPELPAFIYEYVRPSRVLNDDTWLELRTIFDGYKTDVRNGVHRARHVLASLQAALTGRALDDRTSEQAHADDIRIVNAHELIEVHAGSAPVPVQASPAFAMAPFLVASQAATPAYVLVPAPVVIVDPQQQQQADPPQAAHVHPVPGQPGKDRAEDASSRHSGSGKSRSRVAPEEARNEDGELPQMDPPSRKLPALRAWGAPLKGKPSKYAAAHADPDQDASDDS